LDLVAFACPSILTLSDATPNRKCFASCVSSLRKSGLSLSTSRPRFDRGGVLKRVFAEGDFAVTFSWFCVLSAAYRPPIYLQLATHSLTHTPKKYQNRFLDLVHDFQRAVLLVGPHGGVWLSSLCQSVVVDVKAGVRFCTVPFGALTTQEQFFS
jgi:hypothetical protein